MRERGVGLVVLKQQIDTTTPQGRLVFHIFGALDEFQRELIVEGTNEGLAAARARGRVGGRKTVLTPAKRAVAQQMYDSKDHTVDEIAVLCGHLWRLRSTAYQTPEDRAHDGDVHRRSHAEVEVLAAGQLVAVLGRAGG